MDLSTYKPNCPICGKPMEPFWREVGKTQKYVCRNDCWQGGDMVRMYISLDDPDVKRVLERHRTKGGFA